MRHVPSFILALGLLTACAEQPLTPMGEQHRPASLASEGAVVHRVTVGGPDQCSWIGDHPGCDANYSLVAMEWADGRVSGEITDVYGGGFGLHAAVTCLSIGPIPGTDALQAWVGGVVKEPFEMAGHPVMMWVRDRGKSMKDLPDAISRAILDPQDEGYSTNCLDHPGIGLARVAQGQVTIQ